MGLYNDYLGVVLGLSCGGFPQLEVPFLGAPTRSTIVFWGLYWGTPILGKYYDSLNSLKGVV